MPFNHQFQAPFGATLQQFQQLQQQPNQEPPASQSPPATADEDALLEEELDESSGLDSVADDLEVDSVSPEPAPPSPAPAAAADPLNAERRRNNQLEKELRKMRQQLARFSEINPEEYSRLQDAERKKEELERQVAERERQLNEANRRKVLSVEKERDEARQQVLSLRKERLLERLFSEADGRHGGDARGTFFDIFKAQCGSSFRLAADEHGRDLLEAVDGKGQVLTSDGVVISAADYVEELRGHPVYGFLFQQRGAPFMASVPELTFDHNGAPVSLQSMSTAELYLASIRKTTPKGRSTSHAAP
jgi:hypothetical protein